MAERHTIIFDKNIGGNRQQSSINESPVPKDSQSKRREEQIGIGIIGTIIGLSILVSCYTLLSALGIFPKYEAPIINSQPASIPVSSPVTAEVLPVNSMEPSSANTSTSNTAGGTSPATTATGGRINTNDESDQAGRPTTTEATEVTYYAKKGQGVTHLARQAMVDHLNRRGIQLTRQQKLFFETNLTQQSDRSRVRVGSARTFRIAQLDDLLRQAQAQNSAQQSKWNKFLSRYPL